MNYKSIYIALITLFISTTHTLERENLSTSNTQQPPIPSFVRDFFSDVTRNAEAIENKQWYVRSAANTTNAQKYGSQKKSSSYYAATNSLVLAGLTAVANASLNVRPFATNANSSDARTQTNKPSSYSTSGSRSHKRKPGAQQYPEGTKHASTVAFQDNGSDPLLGGLDPMELLSPNSQQSLNELFRDVQNNGSNNPRPSESANATASFPFPTSPFEITDADLLNLPFGLFEHTLFSPTTTSTQQIVNQAELHLPEYTEVTIKESKESGPAAIILSQKATHQIEAALQSASGQRSPEPVLGNFSTAEASANPSAQTLGTLG